MFSNESRSTSADEEDNSKDRVDSEYDEGDEDDDESGEDGKDSVEGVGDRNDKYAVSRPILMPFRVLAFVRCQHDGNV